MGKMKELFMQMQEQQIEINNIDLEYFYEKYLENNSKDLSV